MAYASIPRGPALGPYDRTMNTEYPHERRLRSDLTMGSHPSERTILTPTNEARDVSDFSSEFSTLPLEPSHDAKATSFSHALPSYSFDSLELSNNRRTTEQPKPILQHGLRPILIKILPHVFTILVVISIVQMSFREQYWMDLVPPQQHIIAGLTQGGALNALQLAAKLVEMVILASLSFIIMFTAQRYLLGKSGLPLGLMASPHQVITGELLRRKGFWSSWNTKSTFNGSSPWVYTPFWLLCLLATLLVTVTGPSAAIAVIPGLDWFPMNKPFVSDPSPYYVFNATSELWPDVVSKDSLNGKDSGNECLNSLNRFASDCPAGGFRVLYEWSDNLIFDNLATGSNISTPNDRGDTRRVTNVRTCKGPAAGRATAMSITSALSNALVGYWGFARDNFNGTAMKAAQPKVNLDTTQPLFSPRVDVLCSAYQYDNTTLYKQKEMVFPAINSSTAPSHVPISVLNDTRLLNSTDFIFIESASNDEGISINGLATVPVVSFVNNSWIQTTNMLPCSIYAQWAPVIVWYEPSTQDQVSLQTLDADDRCLETNAYQSQSTTREQRDRRARNMTITSRFAESINQEILFTSYNRSVLAAILDQFCYESGRGPGLLNFRAPQPGSGNITSLPDDVSDRIIADAIAAVVAGVVTDGLSRVAGAGHNPYSAPFFMQHTTGTPNITGLNPISTASGGQTVPLNITEAQLGNYIRLNPTLQRYGYGYKISGNATTQFGISVLLVHLALAVGHTFLVLYKVLVRKEGIGNAFDTIGEIVALALNSEKSSRIQNTCGGISESQTWREVVAVREKYEGHLEMVVGDEGRGAGARARVGVEYGRLKED